LSKVNENLVQVVACELDEVVCKDESFDSPGSFCFFYDTLFTKLYLPLPLFIFEKEVLNELNVCPAKLLPNSWAFIRAFVILCSHFRISPTLNTFFYFFEFKSYKKQPWHSLNSCGGRGLISLFQSSYKNFKGRFVKVQPTPKSLTLLDRFSLYWSRKPCFQSAHQLKQLDPSERGVCEFLENIQIIFDTRTY